MPTEDAYSSGHLVLSHFRTCKWSNIEKKSLLNLSFFPDFLTFLGTSVLLTILASLPVMSKQHAIHKRYK